MTKNAFLTMTALAASMNIMSSSVGWAGELEDALIAKVVDAYGGDRLTDLRSIRIQDTFKNAFPGQGYTSGYVEFTTLKQDAQIDLSNERGSVEAYSSNWNFSTSTRTLSVDDDIVAINYATGAYQPAAAPDFYTAFGAVVRVSDTLLAYELSNRADTAEYQGETMYIGAPHEMINFEMPGSPTLTLYVNKDTGFISKMTRTSGFGDLRYQFRSHTNDGGVGYGADFEFFVGDSVNLVGVSRNVSANSVRDSVFRIDRGIEQEPERIDGSEMTVDEIGDGVHHVGTGPGYSVFVDAGDHVIAAGGYPGLKDRYEAYKEAAGHDKPLRYQIVTHHHTDHLGGMAEALELGVMFVSPANAVANLTTAAGADIPEDRLMIIDGETSLGPVTIYDVATNHAESYALVYVPSANAAFQADHYNGNYIDGVSPAATGGAAMKGVIDGLGIDVDVLLSAHGRKAVPWAEFEAAVAAYEPVRCPANRSICR